MSIRITEDGVVIYENEPDIDRELFPNIPEGGGSPEQIAQAVNTWLEDHPEATTTVMDGSITKEKLDSNLQSELDSMNTDVGELKENLTDLHDTKAAAIYETVSGEIASFSDGADDLPMKSCVVNMEPIQDLHGYDSPWPAGGGENVLDPNIKFTEGTYYGLTLSTTNGYIYTLTGTATSSGNLATTSVASQDADIFPAGTYYSKGGTLSLYRPDGTRIRNQYSNVAFTVDEPFFVMNMYVEIVSGRTYNTNDFIAIVKGSTAPTEWTPYSNICPISGRTGVNVVRTGVNVWDEETKEGYYSAINGTFVSAAGQLCSKNQICVKPSTKYWYYKNTSLGDVLYYGIDGSYLGSKINISIDREFVTPANCYFIQFNIGNNYGSTYNHGISINYPSTDHNYHAYQGETYSVNWETEAGTVYGGTLDVVRGKLVVDRAMVTLDGTHYTLGGRNTFANVARYHVNQSIQLRARARDSLVMADRATPSYDATIGISNNTPTGYYIWVYSSNTVFITLPVDVASSNAEATAWLAENPIQFVYELATPTEIQLTPQEVRTLVGGENNIWSDGGDISVEYPADTKMYINKKITEAIAAAMA